MMEPVPGIGGFGDGHRLTADTRDAVDDFYSAALAAGATDNGGPGVREIYHSNYYGRLRPSTRREQRRGRLPRAGVTGRALLRDGVSWPPPGSTKETTCTRA